MLWCRFLQETTYDQDRGNIDLSEKDGRAVYETPNYRMVSSLDNTFEVPVILVVGDEATAQEAEATFGKEVSCSAVKRGIWNDLSLFENSNYCYDL